MCTSPSVLESLVCVRDHYRREFNSFFFTRALERERGGAARFALACLSEVRRRVWFGSRSCSRHYLHGLMLVLGKGLVCRV